jgi:hypothetical protein
MKPLSYVVLSMWKTEDAAIVWTCILANHAILMGNGVEEAAHRTPDTIPH